MPTCLIVAGPNGAGNGLVSSIICRCLGDQSMTTKVEKPSDGALDMLESLRRAIESSGAYTIKVMDSEFEFGWSQSVSR